MARKPTKTTVVEDLESQIDIDKLSDDANAASVLGSLSQGYAEERDLMNQLLGQAQMAEAFGKFSQTVWSSKLAYVKENKLYRALSGKKSPNGLAYSGTWTEFCGLLGISDEKANQDIENVRTFGEEALESMSRMGIGYREMRQYRKLPEDEKSALLEVAKSGDKDAFIDLAETLVARHVKEKEVLNAKITDIGADHEATEKVLVDRTKKLDKVQKSLEKLQLRTSPWDERVGPFKEEITQRQSIIDESVARHFQAVEALDTWVNKELANAPDYDPEMAASMPVEVLTVLLHLSDAIDRTATLVANAQYEIRNRFGGDIDAVRQQLLDA